MFYLLPLTIYHLNKDRTVSILFLIINPLIKIMEYKVLAAPVEFSEEIKKSRFITYLNKVTDLEDARNYIASLWKEHPKATHICWACVAGVPGDETNYYSTDDGEPSGTAGRPMLAHLVNSQIGFIIAATVRYYGGILLGTGGLCKAYGSGVQQALKLVTTRVEIERSAYFLSCSYEQVGMVKNLLGQFNSQILFEEFVENVNIEFAIPQEEVNELQRLLSDRSAGSLFIFALDE